MNTSFDPKQHPAYSLPVIRRIDASHIARWLSAGWHDLRANPIPSLAYGLLFGLGGDLILLASLADPHLFVVAVSGFFLVAPLLAGGLYELSRQQAKGQRPMFVESLDGFQRNGQSLTLLGLLLALLAILWERTSAVAFAMLGELNFLDIGDFFNNLLASETHTGFVIVWFGLGGMLALLAFALSVVSVPLLVDRKSNLADAMLTSLSACAANPGPLLLWAACIVFLTLLGFATLLFGLVVIMPILGHASWHAYRDLVE